VSTGDAREVLGRRTVGDGRTAESTEGECRGVLRTGRITFWAAQRYAQRIRTDYERSIYHERLPAIIPPRDLSHELVTLSGSRGLPEQIASIRSYLRYAGLPMRLTVVSDGTHTPATTRLITSECPTAEVVHWRELVHNLPVALERYAAQHPLGVKLAVLRELGRIAPALFVDSDVLFFPQADKIPTLIEAGGVHFMRDCTMHGGDRRLVGEWSSRNSTNSGFLILSPRLDWEYGVHVLERLAGEPEWNTEQTICHLVLQRAGAELLDRDLFVVTVEDKWRWRDSAVPMEDRAARHYVGPVRHKMWQAVARIEGRGPLRNEGSPSLS
jgi:hypothetical protein